MYTRTGWGLILCLALGAPAAAQAPKANVPTVVLIGDSIRMGYAPLVAKRLEGKAVIVSAKANGGDSANVLKNLEEFAIRHQPTVIHFNCGLHDLKLAKKDKQYQVPRDQYEQNLRQIVQRLRQETKAQLVFASTTPIADERHRQRGANFDRLEADVRQYNLTALAVMKEAKIPVHDLHWVVEQGGAAKLLGKDGTHYTPAGNALLAEAVADCVLRHLTLAQAKPATVPVPDPKAAAAYQQREKELDALVPPVFKKLPIGTFKVPASAAEWQARRPGIQQTVVQSLGDLPPRPTHLQIRRVTREIRPNYILEKVAIDNGVDGEVSALLLVPAKLAKPAPAILWLHSSTPDKTQIIVPHTNGGAEPLGEVLVRAGYVVLSPDAYWHGDRVGTGPAGAAETGRSEQESLFKYHLWMGRTLWGMFVRDDQLALDYLCSRPEVDKTRIGATGMSMGSTRAWWLAAVDERVTATVGVACLTRYQNLIQHGQLRQHGVYYFVNGLLKHFDTEGVIALIAPRPFLALNGDLDGGSPADGIRLIEEKAGQVYDRLNAADKFRSVLYANIGHVYTPQMRADMLAWFERWLKPGQ